MSLITIISKTFFFLGMSPESLILEKILLRIMKKRNNTISLQKLKMLNQIS